MKRIYQTRNTDFWLVDPTRKVADPFPGRFPTRFVAMQLDANGKQTHSYIGKPNKLLWGRVRRWARIKGKIVLVEFDKGGGIRGLCRRTPNEEFYLQTINPILCQHYYPWQSTNSDFFGVWWPQSKTVSKQVKWGEHTFFIYSPYDDMTTDPCIQKLRDFKTWLRKSKTLKFLTLTDSQSRQVVSKTAPVV